MPENKEKKEIMAGALKSAETLNTKELAATLQAVIENLEKALKKEKGENAKKIEEKLAEAKQLRQKLIDIGKSLLAAKGGNEKAKSKAREEIKNIVGKLDVLLDTREAVEGLKSEIKKPEIKELPTEEELEQVADKARDFETMEKWKGKFTHTAEFAGLSKESAEKYWQAYLETPYLESNVGASTLPFGGRLSPDKIAQKLNGITVKYGGKIPDQVLERMKIEAFGKLVNGRLDELESAEAKIDYGVYEITYFEEKIAEKEKEIEKVLKDHIKSVEWLERLEKKRLSLFTEIGIYTKDSLLGDQELNVNKKIKELEETEKTISSARLEISDIEVKVKNLNGELVEHQYSLLLRRDEDTSQFLLAVSDNFGDDAPLSLKTKIAEAKRKIIKDSKTSKFDRLFYSEKYPEALALLAEQGKERHKSGGGQISLLDALTAYEKWEKSASSYDKEFRKGKFVPLNIPGLTSSSVDCVARKNLDGSFEYATGFPEQLNAPDFVPSFPKKFPKREIAETKNADELVKGNLLKVIAKNPNFEILRSAQSVIADEFDPIFKLFSAGLDGTKTSAFVELAKEHAGKIKKSLSGGALSKLKNNLGAVEKDLKLLRGFHEGILDQFEQGIKNIQASFDNVNNIFKNSNVENFCEEILKDNFKKDTVGTWLIEKGIPFVVTIAAAVAFAIPVSILGGGLFALAAGTTLGGMAGYELGTFGSQLIGRELAGYGAGYSNKTMFGNSLVGEKVFNPATGEYEEIPWQEVVSAYGANFAVGFISTFAFMGAGQYAGKFLMTFATRNSQSIDTFKRLVAAGIGKIPRLSIRNVDVTAKSFLTNFLKEFFEETGEEVSENVSMNINPVLGFFVQFYHCLDGGLLRYNMKGFDVISKGSVTKGKVIETVWTFDARETKAFEQTLRKQYEQKLGFSVEKTSGGNFIVTSKTTGDTPMVRLTFESSNESGAMRRLFSTVDATGKSEMENLYGVERVSGKNNEYAFSNLSPKGKITLAKYLQKSGFIIQGDINTGEFIATKGDAQLTFRLKSLVSGTNINTMEDTKPKTLDNAELAVPANTEAGSTVDSPVIDKLQAGVKGALNVAEVGRRLSERGLPSGFLDGISPDKQLQVLNSVAELEREAGLAGDDKQFGDAVERAKPGEDVFVDESVGSKFLSPKKYVGLLSNTDGLGVYRFALLIAGQKVMPAFSYEQVLKISEVDPQLGEFVIAKLVETQPEIIENFRQNLFENLYELSGGKKKFETLFDAALNWQSVDAFTKLDAIFGKLSKAKVTVLTGIITALAPNTAYALIPVAEQFGTTVEIIAGLWILSWFGVSVGTLTKAGWGLIKKAGGITGEKGLNFFQWRAKRIEETERYQRTRDLARDNLERNDFPPDIPQNIMEGLNARIAGLELRATVRDGVNLQTANRTLGKLENSLRALRRASEHQDERPFALDAEVLADLEGLAPHLQALSDATNADTAVDAIFDIHHYLTEEAPDLLQGLRNRHYRQDQPAGSRLVGPDRRDIVVQTVTDESIESTVDALDPVTSLLNPAGRVIPDNLRTEIQNRSRDRQADPDDDIQEDLDTVGDFFSSLNHFIETVLRPPRNARGHQSFYGLPVLPGDPSTGRQPIDLSTGAQFAPLIRRLQEFRNSIDTGNIKSVARSLSQLAAFIRDSKNDALIHAIQNPQLLPNAETRPMVRNRIIIQTLLAALALAPLAAGAAWYWWPEEKKEEGSPAEGSAEKLQADSAFASFQQTLEFFTDKLAIITKGEETPVVNDANKTYIESTNYSELIGILKTYVGGYIPPLVYGEATRLCGEIRTSLSDTADRTAELTNLVQKLEKLGLDKYEKIGKNPNMHENTPDWLRGQPALYAQVKFLSTSLKGEEPESLKNLGCVTTQDRSDPIKIAFLDEFNKLGDREKLTRFYQWIEDASKVFLESVK